MRITADCVTALAVKRVVKHWTKQGMLVGGQREIPTELAPKNICQDSSNIGPKASTVNRQ